MTQTNISRRSISSDMTIDNRHIKGVAIVFNQPTDMGDFIETIHPISQEFIDTQDIFCLLDHDQSKVLARSNKGVGSLKLTVTPTGIEYDFEAPNTTLGDELIEHLKRGEISGSSFAFVPEDEVWYYEDNILHRDINSFTLLCDVSPVYNPAYNTTSCTLSPTSLRSKEQAQEDYKQHIIEENNKAISFIER